MESDNPATQVFKVPDLFRHISSYDRSLRNIENLSRLSTVSSKAARNITTIDDENVELNSLFYKRSDKRNIPVYKNLKEIKGNIIVDGSHHHNNITKLKILVDQLELKSLRLSIINYGSLEKEELDHYVMLYRSRMIYFVINTISEGMSKQFSTVYKLAEVGKLHGSNYALYNHYMSILLIIDLIPNLKTLLVEEAVYPSIYNIPSGDINTVWLKHSWPDNIVSDFIQQPNITNLKVTDIYVLEALLGQFPNILEIELDVKINLMHFVSNGVTHVNIHLKFPNVNFEIEYYKHLDMTRYQIPRLPNITYKSGNKEDFALSVGTLGGSFLEVSDFIIYVDYGGEKSIELRYDGIYDEKIDYIVDDETYESLQILRLLVLRPEIKYLSVVVPADLGDMTIEIFSRLMPTIGVDKEVHVYDFLDNIALTLDDEYGKLFITNNSYGVRILEAVGPDVKNYIDTVMYVNYTLNVHEKPSDTYNSYSANEPTLEEHEYNIRELKFLTNKFGLQFINAINL